MTLGSYLEPLGPERQLLVIERGAEGLVDGHASAAVDADCQTFPETSLPRGSWDVATTYNWASDL